MIKVPFKGKKRDPDIIIGIFKQVENEEFTDRGMLEARP